jgi:hypothetical protein
MATLSRCSAHPIGIVLLQLHAFRLTAVEDGFGDVGSEQRQPQKAIHETPRNLFSLGNIRRHR